MAGRSAQQSEDLVRDASQHGGWVGNGRLHAGKDIADPATSLDAISNPPNDRYRVEAAGNIAPVAVAALAVDGKGVNEAAVDAGTFSFADLKSYRDPNFLPGAVKYGDLKSLRRLAAAQGIKFIKAAK